MRQLLTIAGLLGLLLAPTPGAAATVVYHSPNDDGQPAAGAATVAEGGVRSVYLYIDGGSATSAPGTPCHTGTGSEVCGFDLHLTGLAGLTLTGFSADASADLVTNLAPASLRINGLDSQSPTPGPKRIGELLVSAVAGGALELTTGEVISADLASEALATQVVVTVPEPALALILASGSVFTAWLARRRSTR